MPGRFASSARLRRGPRLAAVAAALILALTGCSAAAEPPAASPGATGSEPGRLAVSASFYPLAYAVTAVGGDRVAVTTVTKPGVEPHDVELTPADVAGLHASSLVVYLAGMQPAVDAALAGLTTGFDVSAAADLVRAPGTAERASQDTGVDPHFWLDPVRLAAVGTAIGERLAQLDPQSAAAYRAGAGALDAQMRDLDAAYRAGLAQCAHRHLVTSHAAFGYLADRYGFVQVPIAGADPEQEPSARALADVVATVRETGTTTVYTETLVDPKFAETVAASAGARLAVLDPVEGVTASSPGSTYPEIMRANLATLRTGQQCA